MIEHVTPPKAVTGVAATDILTATAHGFLAGQQVAFRTVTGGAGLSVGTPYFVINPTTNTFQLAATLGGAAINFTTDLTAGTVGAAISGVVLDEAGGQGIQFDKTFIGASAATAPCTLVKSRDPGGYTDKRLRFDSVHFQGDLANAYVTAIDAASGTNVELGGRCTFQNINKRFVVDDTSLLRIENEPFLNVGGIYFTNGAGGTKTASKLIKWSGVDDLPGAMAPSGDMWAGGALALTAGRGYFGRLHVDKTIPGLNIGFVLSVAAGSNDNVEVSLHDSAMALIAKSGLIAGKLTGTINQKRTVALAQTIEPGDYFVGFLCPAFGTTGASIIGATLANLGSLQVFAATGSDMMGCQQDGLATMPATIVPVFGTASVAMLWVLE